jgi:Uma2 family endonuclease
MTAARSNPPDPPLMTVEEFFDWPGDGTETKFDLYEGAPRAMAPSLPVHGLIQANAARLFGQHLRVLGRRCPVITEAALTPRMGNNINVRIPDVVVTCAPLGPKDRIVAEPLLIVEVLSPSNERVTQGNVWSYGSIPSVREILLLRSDRVQAEIATKDADGVWPICRRIYIAGSTVTLESIDLSVPVEEFYDLTGLPAPSDANGADATISD